ncbi:MAG: AIPR family protein, partial [Chloroflexi bacterium]|nr:AIPR family protein [Chloroflexota bacterium]
MTTDNATEKVSYEQFREEWLTEIEDGNPSSVEKGSRFATKLVTQWLGVTTDDDDFVFCDGSGDGGIDIACLKRADIDAAAQDENSLEGDTWYLVQSKYGTALTSANTILEEGRKIITTLRGENQNLSEITQQLLQKLEVFRQQASERDRIVLVLATTNPISSEYRQTLQDVKGIGRESIGPVFDVQELSLRTIWEALDVEQTRLSVVVNGDFTDQSYGLLVGTVSLLDLFKFMQLYIKETGDLNHLYQKNVRQFLGGRGRVNKDIAQTLNDHPEKFGLYNNGITIVVSDYTDIGNKDYKLYDPYVVNGCQTTKTIWQILDSKLNAGGTGGDSAISPWKERASRGSVVTKIVRSDEAEINKITRYANSQTAVQQHHFIALDSDFKRWAEELMSEHNIFLEVQRGGADAQRAWEKQHPDQPKCNAHVNAFELLKVYGAGWLGLPGVAFNKNAPFSPEGSVYKQIKSGKDEDPAFGARDLYAAYIIKSTADTLGFGRNPAKDSRRLSRFLFYHVIVRMLAEVIRLTPDFGGSEATERKLTNAVMKLSTPDTRYQWEELSKAAIGLLDSYLTVGGNNCAYNEETFVERHNSDINAFLKAEELGHEKHSPLLVHARACLKSRDAGWGVDCEQV